MTERILLKRVIHHTNLLIFFPKNSIDKPPITTFKVTYKDFVNLTC